MKRLINIIRYWLGIVPDCKHAVHASCWDGPNANRRMMNILSPNFSDAKFKEYAKWMLKRGCDTAHVFLINHRDGEGAGNNCATDANAARLAEKRIKALALDGFAVVPWIVADDSGDWAKDLFAHPEERIKAMAKAGLFDHASYVVLGLEMNEYGNAAQWSAVRDALKKSYKGKVGVHHTSGNSFPFASLGDIVLGQLDPEKSTASEIRNQIFKIKAAGKLAVGFEYSRNPAREKAQAALDAGAFGVGNW